MLTIHTPCEKVTVSKYIVLDELVKIRGANY